MSRYSFAVVSSLIIAVAATAPPAYAQYTIESHRALPTNDAGAEGLRILHADLSRLRIAQDSFFVAHHTYASDTLALHWHSASDARITIVRADTLGWRVEAQYWLATGTESMEIRRATSPAAPN